MLFYTLKRFLFVPPTLLFILFLNFLLIQWAPGGPVDQALANLQGMTEGGGLISDTSAAEGAAFSSGEGASVYRGSQGIDPELLQEIKKMYGFDKPFWTRFWGTVRNYFSGNFGESFFKKRPVLSLIKEKLPVSISLGFWSTILVYLLSLSLGVLKARYPESAFDRVSSVFLVVGYAIPGFLFGLVLIVLFAGGSFWKIFPLRGLTSSTADLWPWYSQIADYFWHMALPLLTQVLGGFASLTLMTKNAFLEELRKPYVLMAYAKGMREKSVLRKHVWRNAGLILVAGFPQAFLHLFFTGSLLTEVLFSLDGLGLLGFQATLSRDYPVIFGTLFIMSLFSLVLHVLSDLLYAKMDPRVHFGTQG